MEYTYTAYTRLINDTAYYFVKRYTCFTELKNTPVLLDSYGMHTNFNKACNIAGITDPAIKQQLFKEASSGVVYSKKMPVLSKIFSIAVVGNKTSLISKFSGLKRTIKSKMPLWRPFPEKIKMS